MQNTNCCQFCNEQNKTRVINILSKPVKVKNYICSSDGVNYPMKSKGVKLQLSVCPTSFCPAACPFCVAKATGLKQRIDLKIFEDIMRRLKSENRIRGIKITGGEPFYDVDLLNEVVSIIFEIFGYDFELSISTNSININQLHRIKDLAHIDAIHISRHHYDDEINKSIFGGAPVASGDELKAIMDTVSYKDIFVFNCMLLKDYINSRQQAHKFLDFAIKTGAQKVGFMTCAPINDFAKAQTIPFESVIEDDDPALLFTRGFYDYDICRCRDGVYASSDGSIIEFYIRSTKMGEYEYSRGLVYDADNHLRDGFGGNIIV